MEARDGGLADARRTDQDDVLAQIDWLWCVHGDPPAVSYYIPIE
jgi:hypothetical protein